ncbi:Flavanone 3-dioxygenase 3, partial [Mucuna pruriens]
MERYESSSSFSTLDSAQEKGLSCPSTMSHVAVIDMAALKNGSATRSGVVQEIRDASRRLGFFQLNGSYVVNHGESESVLDEALFVASKFFDLPTKEKVRYGTSLKDGIDKVQFWRVFLKHYAHPLNDWIHMWPENPSKYRFFIHLMSN